MGSLLQVVASTPTLDTSVITVIGDIATEILGLFSIFPLNVFLVVGLIGLTVGIILRLKRS